jgi:hypothetical protein
MFNEETAMVERVGDLGWNKEYNKKFREVVRETQRTCYYEVRIKHRTSP